jgi:NitT/TauT family transport system ATP-binding protein
MNLLHLTKRYENHTVFHDFSLEIHDGEILCILGASGVGKTTLLNILAGLTSYEGTITEACQRVSYIFQEPRLLPALTVLQNLTYVGMTKEQAVQILQETELLSLARKRPAELSGGERQRVSIARAFGTPFDILLLDEPFSCLDIGLKVRLIEGFAGLWNKVNTDKKHTAVFVTHTVEEAYMLADRIIILKDGKIIFEKQIFRENFPSAYGFYPECHEEIRQLLLET